MAGGACLRFPNWDGALGVREGNILNMMITALSAISCLKGHWL